MNTIDKRMTCELPNDSPAVEVLEAFCGLMVIATFTPSVIYDALEDVADNYKHEEDDAV